MQKSYSNKATKNNLKLKFIFSAFAVDYFLIPFKAGTYGFIFCFLILALVKLVLFSMGKLDVISFSLADVLFSTVGFVYAYGLKVLRNID